MFTKQCPLCGRLQIYKRKWDLWSAIRRNKKCLKCSNGGVNNPRYGKTHTPKAIEKIRKSKIGENNPQFGKQGKLSHNFGKKASYETRLKQSLKRKIYTKEHKYTMKRQRHHFYDWLRDMEIGFEKYVGLSLNEFRIWISRQFKSGMTWENHGKHTWHIDHKKPLSSFDLTKEDEVKKAWHYTNFQPLWAFENLSKGSKI